MTVSTAEATYPAVAGWTPLPTGRRVGVVTLDVLLSAAVGALAVGSYVVAGERTGIAAGVIVAMLAILHLWACLGRSARLAGVLLKAEYRDVETGQRAGGRLLAHHLLVAVLGVVTLGLAPLILFFATVRHPLLRNWFDRATGLMAVDARAGRAPVTDQTGSRGGIAAVDYPAPTPYPGTAGPVGPAPLLQPSAVAQPPLPPVPEVIRPPAPQSAPSGGPAPASEATQVDALSAPTSSFAVEARYRAAVADPDAPVQRLVESGGLITGAPGVAPAARTSPSVPAEPPRPIPVVRERRPAPVDAPRAPVAVLGDGTVHELEPSIVLGRNPVAPGSAPDARPVAVDDPLASKTHLQVGRDDRGAWVLDLHSTNGVHVVHEGAEPARIAPSAKVHLAPGARILFGDQVVIIR